MGLDDLKSAATRWFRLLARPEEEWNLVVAEKPGVVEAILPFSLMGLLASLLMGLMGVLLRFGERNIALELLFHLVVEAGPVAAFAAASALAARRFDAIRPGMGAPVALYSSVGLWIGSCLNLIPVPVLSWLWLALGMGYTGWIYARSMDLAIGIPGHAKVKVMAVALGSALALSILLRIARQLVLSSLGIY